MRATKLASIVLTMGLAFVARPAPSYGTSKTGDPAPHLSVGTFNGPEFSVSTYKSKVVLVSFWATWCPPCRREMPIFTKIYKKYHGAGLEMIALSVDRPRDKEDVLKAARGFPFPVGMLNEAKTNDFGSPASLPVTYVIGQDGIIKAVLGGDSSELSEKDLDSLIRSLLPKG